MSRDDVPFKDLPQSPYDAFVALVHSYHWMSGTCQSELISKMTNAVRDAYDRGVKYGRAQERDARRK